MKTLLIYFYKLSLRKYALPGMLILLCQVSFSQSCTVNTTGTLNWPGNGSTVSCVEGGFAAGKSFLIIPSGLTVNFASGDTWSGTQVQVNGTVNVNDDIVVNSSLLVNNGGRVNLNGRLELGSGNGCGYNTIIQSGGLINVGGSGSDELIICGVDIMTGSGGCNDCGGTNSGKCALNSEAYCEPSGGFAGPLAYDQNGYNVALPIMLNEFSANARQGSIELQWLTVMEKNFSKFIVQRSSDGVSFHKIGEVASKGGDVFNTQTEYVFSDASPTVGHNYYRLQEVDFDNSFNYSKIITATYEGQEELKVYPNPSNGDVISFKINFDASEFDRIQLINSQGVELFNAPASKIHESLTFEPKLKPGIYALKYVSANFKKTVRVIVKN